MAARIVAGWGAGVVGGPRGAGAARGLVNCEGRGECN
jgi:hypothetical protein